MSIRAEGVARFDHRQPLYVEHGDVLQLVCSSTTSTDSIDDVTITWYHNGAPIDPLAVTLTPLHRLVGPRHAELTSKLTVLKATESDSGQYMCISGQGHSDSDDDRINVLIVSELHRSSSSQS